jgi:hypothetical protein
VSNALQVIATITDNFGLRRHHKIRPQGRIFFAPLLPDKICCTHVNPTVICDFQPCTRSFRIDTLGLCGAVCHNQNIVNTWSRHERFSLAESTPHRSPAGLSLMFSADSRRIASSSFLLCAKRRVAPMLSQPINRHGQHNMNAEPLASTEHDKLPAPDRNNQPETPDSPEFYGPKGLEPTRFGDWERSGRCIDF